MTKTLAKSEPNELVKYDYGEDAGLGFDGDIMDSPPWLKLLQNNSNAVTNEEAGAKPGTFFNNLTGDNYGDKLTVLLVNAVHECIERKPDMGGFVTTHPISSPVWLSREGKFPVYTVKGSKNELIECYTLALLILKEGEDPEPVFFTCDRGKIPPIKKVLLKMKKFPGPTWALPLLFSVVPDKNPAGQPIKGLDITKGGEAIPKTDPNYIAAKVLFKKLNATGATAQVYAAEKEANY
jgi:hypothetical protein